MPNAIEKSPARLNSGRQYPLIATAELAFTDLPSGEIVDLFELPNGAVVIGGDIVVTQVTNTTGTDTVAIGDAGLATRYATAVNIKAAARTALTITGYKTSGKVPVAVARTAADAAADQGSVRITVQYMVVGRSNENQG